jgi:hypothetical protein
MAAQAAVGLTGFLEFRARAPEQALMNRLQKQLKKLVTRKGNAIDEDIFGEVAHGVAKAVQTRLLLHALSRIPGMASVESYRLFSACQNKLRFRTLIEIVEAVVIYGDVLPDWWALDVHLITQQLLEQIETVSRGYFEALREAKSHELIGLGEKWVRDLLSILAPHLPPADDKEKHRIPLSALHPADPHFQLGRPEVKDEPSGRFAPLDGPTPPAAVDPMRQMGPITPEFMSRMAKLFSTRPGPRPFPPREGLSPRQKTLSDFSTVVSAATGQTKATDDMRSDILEQVVSQGAFEAGPLEGNPVDGHEVTVPFGDNQSAGAEIFDRPVELSDDLEAYDKLLAESEPVTRELKRVLYPNVERVPKTTRLQTGGSLDSSRLPVAEYSAAAFKRSRMQERPDRRGRPLLLLACDGSASLDRRQMKMTKLLAASWLASTARTRVQVLAALYNSQPISPRVNGPLVNWIYHAEKTPAANQFEAIRAVAALPQKGTGMQADAPSIQLLMDEAQRLSRGRSIYLVLISDTKWNCSVGGESGYAEVRAVLEEQIRQLKERLHVTLVALGVDDDTGFEDVVDAVVRVSDEELTDTAAVAQKIALYVARCMGERRKLMDGTHRRSA